MRPISVPPRPPADRSLHLPAVNLVAATLALVMCVANGADCQIQVPLPTEARLETPRVELELTDARVLVTIDPDSTARFSARLADPDSDELVQLEAEQTPRSMTRVRRIPSDGGASRIVVELGLIPDQTLVLTGERLQVEIVDKVEHGNVVDPAGPAGVADTPPQDSAATAVDTGSAIAITLVDSQLSAFNLGDLSLIATGGSNDIDGVAGAVDLELRDTELHARRVQGAVTLKASASQVTFDDCEGSLVVELEGGLLATNGSSMSLQGTLARAEVELRSVSKTVRLTGSDSSIRIAEGGKVPIQIDGTELLIFVDDVGGPLKSSLKGGSVEASTVGTRIDLALSAGAEADLDTVDGDLAIVMTDGARARVEGVVGHTRVRLQDSDLEVSGLKSIDLNARGGSVTGSGIRQLTHIEIDGSAVDFRLDDIRGKSELILRGSTTAYVQVPTPCRVTAKMPATTQGDHLRVTGCSLYLDSATKRDIRRGVNGRETIQLTANLDETATLEVDGRP